MVPTVSLTTATTFSPECCQTRDREMWLHGTQLAPGQGGTPGTGDGPPALHYLFALGSLPQQLDHVLPHAARGAEALGPAQQHSLQERQEWGLGLVPQGPPIPPELPPHLVQAQLLAGEGEGEAKRQDLLHQVLLQLEVHDALDDVVEELRRAATVSGAKMGGCRGGLPALSRARGQREVRQFPPRPSATGPQPHRLAGALRDGGRDGVDLAGDADAILRHAHHQHPEIGSPQVQRQEFASLCGEPAQDISVATAFAAPPSPGPRPSPVPSGVLQT